MEHRHAVANVPDLARPGGIAGPAVAERARPLRLVHGGKRYPGLGGFPGRQRQTGHDLVAAPRPWLRREALGRLGPCRQRDTHRKPGRAGAQELTSTHIVLPLLRLCGNPLEVCEPISAMSRRHEANRPGDGTRRWARDGGDPGPSISSYGSDRRACSRDNPEPAYWSGRIAATAPDSAGPAPRAAPPRRADLPG